ncbi:hypothetical protein [Nocardia cyriacigeorgica]|uniref:hypothetical protein n=1 Tax=Nocardia cyriacigeorgica TaxID=135487 RepID=UPI0013D74C24|nr:hypothetical protein [Nocardia cyriacigeorgica]NEW27244.1 hypothetical protein [Nocardia cyriacigeorgica]
MRVRQLGKLTTLLALIRDHEDQLEADLAHHCNGLRYTDRWRYDEHGVPLLTLREIWVRIQQLPGDSELVMLGNDGRPRWSDADFLLSDIVHVLSGKPHPARPKPRKRERETPRRAALRRRRIAEKRRREAEGG